MPLLLHYNLSVKTFTRGISAVSTSMAAVLNINYCNMIITNCRMFSEYILIRDFPSFCNSFCLFCMHANQLPDFCPSLYVFGYLVFDSKSNFCKTVENSTIIFNKFSFNAQNIPSRRLNLRNPITPNHSFRRVRN